MEIAKKIYWNKRSETYNLLDSVGTRQAYRIANIVKMFSINNPFVVDVGCGPGIISRIVKERLRTSKVLGIDISERMIDFAKRSIINNLGFLESDFLDDSLQKHLNNRVDVFIMSLFMHHMADGKDLIVLEKSYELLKNNGYILVAEAVPPEDEILGEYKLIFSFKETRNCYIPSNLISMLRKVGFIGVRFVDYPFKIKLKNWLNDKTLSEWRKGLIYDLHVNATPQFKKAYNMVAFPGGDYELTCKMCLVWGQKRV